METLRSRLPGVHLPHRLVLELRKEDESQKARHKRLLEVACTNSGWSKVVRDDLIIKLSHKPLTDTQRQALSLGLKFDTGTLRKGMADCIESNYRRNLSALERGFLQGVVTCAVASAKGREPAIPARYTRALQELGRDESIVIAPADKGGGVVIIDNTDYVSKMEILLSDVSTYRKAKRGNAEERSLEFNRAARKVLRGSEKGKSMLHLLEETPRVPTIRGSIKTHKEGNPVRPITNGTGSAPHRLAKKLAAPLSAALNSISGCHLSNTSDMMAKLQGVGMKCKKLVSFDVKSLFTNVPIDGAIKAAQRALRRMDQNELPLQIDDYIELIRLCVEFGPFEFRGREYEQIQGLAMGSPLSAVLAQLFMETLEADHYRNIVGRNVVWLRYVDDILAVVPTRTNLPDLLHRLNAVHPSIQFTTEEERDEQLPFLDTMIHRRPNGPVFSVYRKPTNKDDFIHYFSAHSKRTKEGVVIGFFLRALRICSPEFLEDEMKHVYNTFQHLHYPRSMLTHLRRKAEKIMSRPRGEDTQSRTQRIIIPHSELTEHLQALVGHTLKIATSSGKKIGDIVREKRSNHNRPLSQVYSIPCGGCDKVYIGETSRGLHEQRISQHRSALRRHDTRSAFVVHADTDGHLPKWSQASIIKQGLAPRQRKMVEAAFIHTTNNINTATGSHELAKVVAHLITDVT